MTREVFTWAEPARGLGGQMHCRCWRARYLGPRLGSAFSCHGRVARRYPLREGPYSNRRTSRVRQAGILSKKNGDIAKMK